MSAPFDLEQEKQSIFSDFPALRGRVFILGHAPDAAEKNRLFAAVGTGHGPIRPTDEKQLDFILTQAERGRAAIVGLPPHDRNADPFAVISAGKFDDHIPAADGLFGFFKHFGLKPPADITPVMIAQSRLDHELGHVLTIPRLKTAFNMVSMGVRVTMPLKQERAADALAALRHHTARYGGKSRFPVLLSDLRLMSVLLGAADQDYYTTPAIDRACKMRKTAAVRQDLAGAAIHCTLAADEPEYTQTLAQQAGTHFHFARASAKPSDIVAAAKDMCQDDALRPLAQRVLAGMARLAPKS